MLNKAIPVSLLAMSLCLAPACGGSSDDDDDGSDYGGVAHKTDAGISSTSDAGGHGADAGSDAGTSGGDAGETAPDAGDEGDCGAVTAVGECDSNNNLRICQGGVLSVTNCMPYVCGYDSKKKVYDCLDDCLEECGSIGESGKCIDSKTLKYCSPYSGCLMTEECGSKTCSYVGDREQYECVK